MKQQIRMKRQIPFERALKRFLNQSRNKCAVIGMWVDEVLYCHYDNFYFVIFFFSTDKLRD